MIDDARWITWAVVRSPQQLLLPPGGAPVALATEDGRWPRGEAILWLYVHRTWLHALTAVRDSLPQLPERPLRALALTARLRRGPDAIVYLSRASGGRPLRDALAALGVVVVNP